MKILLLLSVLLIQGSVHTAWSRIFSQSKAEGGVVSLVCNNNGTVMWEKCTDGGRSSILRAENGEITNKYKHNPETRYSVLTDLSLIIKGLSVSDSGIYCCNRAAVMNLIVILASESGEKHHTADGSCCSPERSRDKDKARRSKPTTAAPIKTSSNNKGEKGSGDNPPTTAPITPTTTSKTTHTSATSSAQSITEPSETGDQTTTSSTSSEVKSKADRTSTHLSTGGTSIENHISSPIIPTPTATSVQSSTVSSTISPTISTTSTTTTSAKSRTAGISVAVALAGAGLVLLAVVLMRRCSKQKAHENEHVYATITDSPAPTAQTDSAPPREYEAVYYLAGDPDIVKLGLKNQTADSPLIPQTTPPENLSDLVYSVVQPVHTALMKEDQPDLQFNTE